MSQAANSPTTTHVCAATPSEIPYIAPTNAELADMAARLDAVDPRPPLTDWATWIAEGIEAAAETREFERRRASLMRGIYGDDIDEAA